MDGSAVQQIHQQQQQQPPQASIVCNGCKQGLEETSDSVVVSFGDGLWHVDCRCAKCQNLVEHDTNLLLLADGSPVCENCSYVCSFCQQSISNEAIVTGDESYHADCFRCKNCNTRIEELVFAKTTQGIYCMSCHNERVARTRKHAESKRNKSLRRGQRHRERDGTSSSSAGPGSDRTSSSRSRTTTGMTTTSSSSNSSHRHQDSSMSMTHMPVSPQPPSSNTLSSSANSSSYPSANALEPPSPYLSPLLRNNELSPLTDGDEGKEKVLPLTSPRGNASRHETLSEQPPPPPSGLKRLRQVGNERERGDSLSSSLPRHLGTSPHRSQHQGLPSDPMHRSKSDPNTKDKPSTALSDALSSSVSSPSRPTFETATAGPVESSKSPRIHSRSSSLGGDEIVSTGPALLTQKPSFELPSSASTSSFNDLSSSTIEVPRRPSIGDETVLGPSLSRSAPPAPSVLSTSPSLRSNGFGAGGRGREPGLDFDVARPRSPAAAAADGTGPNDMLSLSAPKSNKNANRRSGFYGVNQITSPPLSAASTAGATAASSMASPVSGHAELSRDDYFLQHSRSMSSLRGKTSDDSAAVRDDRNPHDRTEIDDTINDSSMSQSASSLSKKNLQPLPPPPRSDSKSSDLATLLRNTAQKGSSSNGGVPVEDAAASSSKAVPFDPSSSSSTISTTAVSSSSLSEAAEIVTRPANPSSNGAHSSLSFYDPDVLVFLDAVNDPTSLRRSSTAFTNAQTQYNNSSTPTKLPQPSAVLHDNDEPKKKADEISSPPPTRPSPQLSPAFSPAPRRSGALGEKGRISTFSNSTVEEAEEDENDEDIEQEHLSPASMTRNRSRRRSSNGLGISNGSTSRSSSTNRRNRRSSRLGNINDDGREEEDDETEDKAKFALRKVRESIRRSRGGSLSNGSGAPSGTTGDHASSGMTLDVELVELLISELEQTKNKMKELQKNYNAIRRASRSAFEGFSMAREEYDREVQARRDAEFEMLRLKQQMKEQANKLSLLDEENKKQELLQKKNTELRNSVVGMEKELSKIRVERDITMAEIEELATVPKNDSKASVDAERLSANLNNRLSTVKEGYRSELEQLAEEKERIQQEVEELKMTKDRHSEESDKLDKRNAEVQEEISEHAQRLETLRAEITKAQQTLDDLTSENAQASKAKSLAVARAEALPLPRGGNDRSALPSLYSSAGSSSIASIQPLSVNRTANNRLLPTTPAGSDEQASAYVAHKVEHATPQIVPRKFKWGSKKGLERPLNASISKHPLQSRNLAPAELHARQHAFQPTSILRPVRCEHCGDKMWGMGEQRCAACGIYCHTKCMSSFHIICNSAASIEESPEPPSAFTMFGNDLVAQCLTENRLIPMVVTTCIEAVEAAGMEHEGIYRKSGGMGQTKLISACFDRGDPFDLTDQDRFNDISAITSVLKNYFRSLPNPLYTFEFHQDFCSLAEMKQSEARLSALENLLHSLPEQHFATLKTLMLHLNRIHRQSYINKMTPANLGVVFGPTLLRSPDPSQEFSQMHLKARIVELTVENAIHLFSDPFKGAS